MRSDRLYLSDMVGAAESIRRFVAGKSIDNFIYNELLQSAVLQKLIVMGEAAARVSPGFGEAHPEVEWQDIAAFRNFAVHAYFAVDWRIVRETATVDAAQAGKTVQHLLDNAKDL